jgi:tRNA (guanine-N7-)-methyltransferase
MIINQIKSYALRSGRMTEAQQRAYAALSPRFVIPAGGSTDSYIDWAAVFGNDHPVTVEIGFGMGDSTAELAGANPGMNYAGIEVFKGGIGKLLWEIEKRDLKNIRIIEGDAAEIAANRFRDGSVAAFHIFFPDPWPKKRHHKRRLVKKPFTAALAQKLLPGGYVAMVTDWADYAEQALSELSQTAGLENPYDAYAPKMAWRRETKFEKKGIKSERAIWELYFEKKGLEEGYGV